MENLVEKVRVRVRFSEVDPLRMVWHGNYVKYLEDAREAFGLRYGISYMDIFNSGCYAPVFDMHLRFSKPARLDDILLVTIRYRHAIGAKLVFDYEIRRESDGELMLEATTIQLFTNHDGVLEVSEPEFYRRWKRKLVPDFYSVLSSEKNDGGSVYRISINEGCSVYEGHFPQGPVSPGVCLVEMVKECAEDTLGRPVSIAGIKRCRFSKLVSPGNVPQADVVLSLSKPAPDGSVTLSGKIVAEDAEYMSITCELIPG